MSLMDTQSHSLLHFLVRMKPTSTNVFLLVAKNVEVTRGKIWAVRRMLKCFPAKSVKPIHYQTGSVGTGIIMHKDDSVRQRSREFWLYGVFQHPQPQRKEPRLSAFVFLPPFPILDEHTLSYAHLQNHKEITAWAWSFSLCISPTLEMAVSIRNNSVDRFCEECAFWWVIGFHLSAPHKLRHVNYLLAFGAIIGWNSF